MSRFPSPHGGAGAGGGQRILVVTPAWVGDVVMAQSLFAVLRRQEPDAVLDALAPSWAVGLIGRMSEVDEVIALPMGHGELAPLAQWRVGREVRRRRYDRAIVCRRSFKSAIVPFLAGIPQRTGVRGESRWLLVNDVRAVTSESHPAAAVRLAVLGMEPGAAPGLEDIPWPRLVTDPGRGASLERALGIGGPEVAVGLAPGAAFGPAKRWPAERWRELASRLCRDGYRVWIFGSAGERGDAETIAGGAGGRCMNLCGATSLVDVLDLMARCGAVVSNDSGLMHVAAASGTRVVALFGSTSPHNTPPLDRDARVLWRGLACSPCYRRTCPLGHLNCLREIHVAEVLEALRAESAPPRS